MKQALGLLLLVLGVLEAGRASFGDPRLAVVMSGAMALMALMIAATFLWLWLERATPLALGMVHAWAGVAAFSGGWWATALGEGADWPGTPPGSGLVTGLFLVGALLHFAVIQRSFGRHGVAFLWPVAVAFSVAAAVALLV